MMYNFPSKIKQNLQIKPRCVENKFQGDNSAYSIIIIPKTNISK